MAQPQLFEFIDRFWLFSWVTLCGYPTLLLWQIATDIETSFKESVWQAYQANGWALLCGCCGRICWVIIINTKGKATMVCDIGIWFVAFKGSTKSFQGLKSLQTWVSLLNSLIAFNSLNVELRVCFLETMLLLSILPIYWIAEVSNVFLLLTLVLIIN